MFVCPRPFLNTAKRVESVSLVCHGQTTTDHAAASLPDQREPSRIHPPKKYLAVYAQVVLAGPAADVPMVARVSLTDYRGQVLLDTFVRPSQPVTDYRHAITGLKPEHLMNAPQFSTVQRQIASMIHGKIIVGYMLWHFLSVLGIPHPAFDTRDVAVFVPFRRSLKCRQILPLSVLVNKLMGRNIGYGYEHPLENARASLDLFRSCEKVWEDVIQSGSWPCLLPPVAYANFFS